MIFKTLKTSLSHGNKRLTLAKIFIPAIYFLERSSSNKWRLHGHRIAYIISVFIIIIIFIIIILWFNFRTFGFLAG